MNSTRAILTCSLIAAATAKQAVAQPAGAQAEVLFREGRDLMKVGNTVEACAAFEQSQRIEPAVTTLINLAACREKLGQLATAWGLFLEVERQTRSMGNQAAEQLHKVAVERASKLESRVPKLTISVPDKSKIDGLEILRDKESIPAVMWNRALPIDGGTYTITARAPGTNDWSTRVTLASEADVQTVAVPDLRNLKRDFDVHSNEQSGKALPSIPAQPPEAPAGRRGSFVPIAVGVGAVVLLGGALGFSLWGDSMYDKAKAEMMDQARRDSLYNSANTKRYIALGLAVVGVGCAGGAIWLYLRQRGAHSETSSAHAGHLIIMPTASGIGVVGRF